MSTASGAGIHTSQCGVAESWSSCRTVRCCVPAGMGMPTGAQHWGAAGAGAYMVPTSMGMVAAGTPMQAMYPGVGGYMMVPGAYMMAGVGTVAPSAWPTQWQQFQQ